MLQHDRQLKVISRAIEKKIRTELEKMLESERAKYEKLFDAFGVQLKFGVYSDYGMHKDNLKDLLLFHSSNEKKYVTLKEYVGGMKGEQKAIYYATGDTMEKIELLPQVEAVKSLGYEVLYLTDEVDEFALKVLGKYEDKEFKNVTAEALDLGSDEEKEQVKKANEEAAEMLDFMKEALKNVSAVRFTSALSKHPACLRSEGELSLGMEKVLKKMPGAEDAPKAELVMEINISRPITEKLKMLYESDKDTLEKYAKLLYAESCLIAGITPENTGEFCQLISELMIK
jgi:molecular chaperone HtpG